MPAEVLDLHPLAIRACVERNAVPKVRAYRDHVFVVLHAPELGQGGHVRYVELDQFIGPHYIECYKARTDTKVTIAAERLALIAVLTPSHHRPVVGVRDEPHRQRPDRLRPT